jgi:hypothetical protein
VRRDVKFKDNFSSRKSQDSLAMIEDEEKWVMKDEK